MRKQVVAGQDGDAVAPARVGGLRPAAHRRLVHHIVVVERGQVDQFDDGGSGDDGFVCRFRSELAGQNGEQRTEPFSSRLREMKSCLGEEVLAVGQLGDHQLLDALQSGGDGSCKLRIDEIHPGNDRRSGRVVCAHDCWSCPVRPATVSLRSRLTPALP